MPISYNLVGIRDFMQYRENPDQIGMVGQPSLCKKKAKESSTFVHVNINMMYSLWILPTLGVNQPKEPGKLWLLCGLQRSWASNVFQKE